MPYVYKTLLEQARGEEVETRVTLRMPAREGQTVTLGGEDWVVTEVDEDTGPTSTASSAAGRRPETPLRSAILSRARA